MHIVVKYETQNERNIARVCGINVEAKENTKPTHKRSKPAITPRCSLREMLQVPRNRVGKSWGNRHHDYI